MTEYKLLVAASAESLSEIVSRYIGGHDSWKLYGNPIATAASAEAGYIDEKFAQAVVR